MIYVCNDHISVNNNVTVNYQSSTSFCEIRIQILQSDGCVITESESHKCVKYICLRKEII